MYPEDLLTFRVRGQVDAVELIESAFTGEFDRQRLDVVRRRDDVNRAGAIGKPFQEDPERPLGSAAVHITADTAESLLDLVELQDA